MHFPFSLLANHFVSIHAIKFPSVILDKYLIVISLIDFPNSPFNIQHTKYPTKENLLIVSFLFHFYIVHAEFHFQIEERERGKEQNRIIKFSIKKNALENRISISFHL